MIQSSETRRMLPAERTGRGSWGASDQMVVGRLQGSGISLGWERIKGEDREDTDEAAGRISWTGGGGSMLDWGWSMLGTHWGWPG